jgi:hypothetical protein
MALSASMAVMAMVAAAWRKQLIIIGLRRKKAQNIGNGSYLAKISALSLARRARAAYVSA